MIAPLRRRHRFFFTAAVLLLPALWLVVWNARGGLGYEELTPPTLYTTDAAYAGELQIPPAEIGIRVFVDSDTGPANLGLYPNAAVTKPDVLVYWSLSDAAQQMPANALLLGPLGEQARTFSLPTSAATQDGHLIFLSLGHQEIIASAPLPAVLAPEPAEQDRGAENPKPENLDNRPLDEAAS